jgi:hypothetical protein
LAVISHVIGDLLRLKEVETGVVRALKEVSSDEGAGAGLYEHRLEFLSEVSKSFYNISHYRAKTASLQSSLRLMITPLCSKALYRLHCKEWILI